MKAKLVAAAAHGVCLTADMCEFHAHQWVREPS